jgi:hypothetical protein
MSDLLERLSAEKISRRDAVLGIARGASDAALTTSFLAHATEFTGQSVAAPAVVAPSRVGRGVAGGRQGSAQRQRGQLPGGSGSRGGCRARRGSGRRGCWCGRWGGGRWCRCRRSRNVGAGRRRHVRGRSPWAGCRRGGCCGRWCEALVRFAGTAAGTQQGCCSSQGVKPCHACAAGAAGTGRIEHAGGGG